MSCIRRWTRSETRHRSYCARLSRSYTRSFNSISKGPIDLGLYHFQRRAYAEASRAEAPPRLIPRPLNNAGVFAMAAASPAWDVWASLLADVATRSTNMIDQIALNAAIYESRLREVRLPATCNWIAHLATPAWDEASAAFVGPDPPFATIGILHLTLGTKWEPSLQIPIAGAPDRSITRSLRYER